MSTISVKASVCYDVEIAPGLLSLLGQKTAPLVSGRSAALVTDDVVAPLYAEQARVSLEAAGFTVCTYAFPHGERSKNGATYLHLLDFLAEHRLTRTDLLVALGGGVPGDLAGFAAATYLRGIAYVQVPTTLLSMVDSSVGGKTAINLPAGKNLAGAFYQPRLALCDTDTLSTLPREVFRDGCAEVIKYGILGSRPLFSLLQGGPDRQQWPEIIAACVRMKRDTVEADEFDTGRRQLLNLGHTLGHAVEAGSGFTLSHGKSVAIGIATITRAAARFGFCTPGTRDEILNLLRLYGLPVESPLEPEVLYQAALGDKKRQGGSLTLAIPREVGRCTLHAIAVEELRRWIAAGWVEP